LEDEAEEGVAEHVRLVDGWHQLQIAMARDDGMTVREALAHLEREPSAAPLLREALDGISRGRADAVRSSSPDAFVKPRTATSEARCSARSEIRRKLSAGCSRMCLERRPLLTDTFCSVNYVVAADAEKFLGALRDASVDLFLIDPPYFRIVRDLWDHQWESAELTPNGWSTCACWLGGR
jgi:hypothetical protein